ncbi:MAG: MarR family transcriptional regulator [Sphingobacteriales bacterium]|nr:MarR family transcriptional regulator [Sphingobacteriales bacterium]
MKGSQSPPVPPLLLRQIGGLHKQVYKECDRIFRELDFPLEMDQIPVLMLLYYHGSASQQEICVSLHRDKASVNRTVAFLAREDMAVVIQDAVDKRKTRVELTATGKNLAKQANNVITAFDEGLVKTLSPEERQQLHTLLNKLIETVNITHVNF